jgi:hypothetical protein
MNLIFILIFKFNYDITIFTVFKQLIHLNQLYSFDSVFNNDKLFHLSEFQFLCTVHFFKVKSRTLSLLR